MSDNEMEECSVFSRNPKVTALLELCIQPKTRKEMQHALLDFWDKFEKIKSSHNCSSEDFTEFDVAIMYALGYNYDHHSSATLSAVARSLQAYLKQAEFLPEDGSNRDVLINGGNDCFMSAIRRVTDFNHPESEEILSRAVVHSVLAGSLGLTKFLVKFGLVHFPLEIDENSRTLVKHCVSLFNIWNIGRVGDIMFNSTEPVQVDDLLNRMQQNREITFRRSMFIWCKFCLFFEFMQFNDTVPGHILFKCFSLRKLLCLQLFETTVEQDVTLKDIEYFLQTFLSGLLNGDVWRYFQERYHELYSDRFIYRYIRSLKDICRCKIRECLLSSARMLPQQVSKLPIPTSLEEYLFFEYDGIWEALVGDQKLIYANAFLLQHINSE